MNDNTTPRVIPETFRENGWDYTLVRRDGKYAIYRQGGPNRPAAFEVHVIRRSTSDRVFKEKVATLADGTKKVYPETVIPTGSEFLAGNEDFGSYAWSLPTLEAAEKKLTDIKKKHRLAEKKEKNVAK
jgi:hypothetical protein